jgi:3-deoxy-7-phosphoheptulonate synthase
MLIVMKPQATAEQVQSVVERVEELGFRAHPMPGSQRTAIGITGNRGPVPEACFASLEGIAQLVPVSQPFKLVSREMQPETTQIRFSNGVVVGGGDFHVMAGPCSVESEEQILATARAVRARGATFLRGGAFKPRTSPYEFQGLKEEGLKLLARAREETGLLVVTEVKDTETLDMVCKYTDVLQIGARNMQNYSLLEAVGHTRIPVLLKRGLSATIKELLMSAEYIFSAGNQQIMLCERGIRTFEPMTRNTLDLGAVAVLRHVSHLPVIVDPSHGIGIRRHVPGLARAAAALGCEGLIVEVHPDPDRALSDGAQSLTVEMFGAMMDQIRGILAATAEEPA